MSKLTKAELQERLDIVSALLYEAIAILRGEGSRDDDEIDFWVEEFLRRCQLEGYA